MSKFKNSNATFWVIFKQLLFTIRGSMQFFCFLDKWSFLSSPLVIRISKEWPTKTKSKTLILDRKMQFFLAYAFWLGLLLPTYNYFCSTTTVLQQKDCSMTSQVHLVYALGWWTLETFEGLSFSSDFLYCCVKIFWLCHCTVQQKCTGI